MLNSDGKLVIADLERNFKELCLTLSKEPLKVLENMNDLLQQIKNDERYIQRKEQKIKDRRKNQLDRITHLKTLINLLSTPKAEEDSDSDSSDSSSEQINSHH